MVALKPESKPVEIKDGASPLELMRVFLRENYPYLDCVCDIFNAILVVIRSESGNEVCRLTELDFCGTAPDPGKFMIRARQLISAALKTE